LVWSLADRQGSVVDLVDVQGNVLNHFVYDSFGNRTATTAADFRFGYTGRELDGESGLYYYRARYYDPSLGRFISEDPIGFSAGDTNLYRYVSNSPTNFTDPTGTVISGWAEDALYAADAFFAGFGNVVSFGITNQIRSTNRLAVENQQGGWYNLGTGVGILTSLALNPLGAGSNLAKGAAAGYQGFGTVYGVLESGGNILSGKGTGWDALNLLPFAVPLAGFAIKGAGQAWRRYQDSASDIAKRAATRENVLSNLAESQQAREKSHFADFSRDASDFVPEGYNSRLGPQDLLLADGETLNPIYRGRVQTLVTAENLTYRSGNLSQTKINTLDKISQFLGGTATVGQIPGNKRAEYRSGKKSVCYANIDIENLPTRLNSFSGQYSLEGSSFKSYPSYVDPSNRQLKSLKFQGSKLNPASDGEAKIAEFIYRNTTTDSIGSVQVVTDRASCDSCSYILARLAQERPGITIVVIQK
jgi:RHS repeat-associated protein